MKLRSPYTELLFNLSPSTNVTESLKTFGIPERCTEAIALRIVSEAQPKPTTLENDLRIALNCEIVEFSKLTEKCDFSAIKQVYKPTVSETEKTKFFGEIVTLLATKNI